MCVDFVTRTARFFIVTRRLRCASGSVSSRNACCGFDTLSVHLRSASGRSGGAMSSASLCVLRLPCRCIVCLPFAPLALICSVNIYRISNIKVRPTSGKQRLSADNERRLKRCVEAFTRAEPFAVLDYSSALRRTAERNEDETCQEELERTRSGVIA